ncbi:hypothetical protein HNI00_14810 [Thermoleptolyngbya oregonensis NK1-22]|uniref:Uncharacterized protein n=1 Tax=Thermoleptolyngbya oregonensis NK1-22 TaxID=2547457 RepID=A0AA96YCI1_9CYAN|nr:hypothetical protein [Thermoleptolyngbya oregonensis]WOB44270.1 hypothetical protein HNI00_14810 [Thermoleptolyngbya oregonensis NK1-22]
MPPIGFFIRLSNLGETKWRSPKHSVKIARHRCFLGSLLFEQPAFWAACLSN